MAGERVRGEWEGTEAQLYHELSKRRPVESWFDKVMHHANQMLAYTPPEEDELRQAIMALQDKLAGRKGKGRHKPYGG